MVGGVTWVGALGLGVGEGTPAGESSDRRFFPALGVGVALWLAVAVIIVRQWWKREPTWFFPFMWWIPSLVIAIIVASAI